MIKVALAEDNSNLARSLIEKLGFFDDVRMKFWCRNGKELLDKMQYDYNVDLVLMDINMPVMDGIEATGRIKQKWPQIKVVISTVFDEEDYLFKAILAGANGYLLKDEKPGAIHRSILEVMDGGAPMSPEIATKSLKLIRNPLEKETPKPKEDYKLTKREIELLEQLSKGLSYKEIAANLFISQGTVRKHIENIYRKLQVNNKLQAVETARNSGVI